MTLQDGVRRVAEMRGFSGVALVEQGTERLALVVSGYADRAERRPIKASTRFATASATKGFTALMVASLIESAVVGFDTPIVALVGDDLPLVDERVTIEHLLGHTSGVGDYIDEANLGHVDEHVLGVSAHVLEGPEDFLPLLNRHRQVSEPGSVFAYNNSGYVILALAAERAAGAPYHQLVRDRVFDPAGMSSTDFLRSDYLPAGAACGYLENGRSNIFHLPVIGSGDGGAYTTATDISTFWRALHDGHIVSPGMLERLTTARRPLRSGRPNYGLGFWIGEDSRTVELEGMDAGVSFRSSHRPTTGLTSTVISNTSSGAWPLVSYLEERL